ncbi:MAG: hypothetical protein RIT81_45965 [Deltaproteobacteria bacterium]
MRGERVGSFRLHRDLHDGRAARYSIASHVDEGRNPGAFVVARYHDRVADDEEARADLAAAWEARGERVTSRVASVVEHELTPALTYVATRYLPGIDLAAFARMEREQKRRIDVPFAARIVAEAARTLDDVGEVIGFDAIDFDAQNVRLGWDGAVRLTLPVTLALDVDDSTPAAPDLRQPSPEGVIGAELTAPSLVFQLGLVLYWLVEGRHPFQGSTPMGTFMRIVESRPDPLTHPSAELDAIVGCALQREQIRRFATPREMAEAIEAQLAPAPTASVAETLGARCAQARQEDLDLDDDFSTAGTQTQPDPEEQTVEDAGPVFLD